MSDGTVLWVTGIVVGGVTAFLFFMLGKSIVDERRRSRLRRTWSNFGLSIAFAGLFLLSWGAQAAAEWGTYRQEQQAHGEPTVVSDYLVQFGQSTLENWQSEFLQLFSFVVLSAMLIHRGSAESKDSDDRLEVKVDDILKRLDALEPDEETAASR
jgi:hypothetical protein